MDELQAMRERIIYFGRMLFDRQLTDAAGGNVSARVGDKICITPRFAGQKSQWQLHVEQVLVCDLAGNVLDGEGIPSRESKAHLKLYNDFPDCNSVIHCHPRNVLVFCAQNQSILPVIEATMKFGEIKIVPYAPAHSQLLADLVTGALVGQEARIRKHAAGVMARWHGLFVAGKDIDAAFDAVERIDTNARIILLSGGMASGRAMARDLSAALESDLAAAEK